MAYNIYCDSITDNTKKQTRKSNVNDNPFKDWISKRKAALQQAKVKNS